MEEPITQPPVFNPQQQPVAQQGPQPSMSFGKAVKTCFNKFFTLRGRARRSEYWWYLLFYVIMNYAFGFLGLISPVVTIVTNVVSLILVLPLIAVTVRRLHDHNHTGWWVGLSMVLSLFYMGVAMYLFYPVMSKIFTGEMQTVDLASLTNVAEEIAKANPSFLIVLSISLLAVFVMSIVMLVFTLQDSQRGTNDYGPSPKYPD